MEKQLIFNFKTDISKINICSNLNNPFALVIPKIAKIAAKEFQNFITKECQRWKHDFRTQKGKMFGILVVQKEDNTYGFLGAVSGKTPVNITDNKFIPSIFDDSVDDFFINKGMKVLAEISTKIKKTKNKSEINAFTEQRKQKSFELQKQLFENYRILNILGIEKNVLQIFKGSSHGNPPSAAGECAAPKLLHYAFKQKLKPIGLAEFWWGNGITNIEREHKVFYPACKSKCRPILEYMLNDTELFNEARASF